MASSTKPVIVVVHGAWHQPMHYAGIITPLREEGYTVLAPSLVTTGSDPSQIEGKTMQDDATLVRGVIEGQMNQGHNVVVVCHSYGALVSTEAAAGQSPQERAAKGLKGGVTGLVYISALLFPKPGMSCWNTLFGSGSNLAPWMSISETYTEICDPMIFYHDVEKPLIDICIFAMRKQSFASIKSPITRTAAEIKSRKIFVVCTEAQNHSAEEQAGMAKMAEAEIAEVAASHSPFLGKTQIPELLKIIRGV